MSNDLNQNPASLFDNPMPKLAAPRPSIKSPAPLSLPNIKYLTCVRANMMVNVKGSLSYLHQKLTITLNASSVTTLFSTAGCAVIVNA